MQLKTIKGFIKELDVLMQLEHRLYDLWKLLPSYKANMDPPLLAIVDEATEVLLKSKASLIGEIQDLERQLAATTQFCDIQKCPKCIGYYPLGYICGCGHDNSLQEIENE